MVNVTQREMGGITYTDITLTIGNACTIILPVYSVANDGTKSDYSPSGSDEIEITVRRSPIETESATPVVVFEGVVSFSGGKANWEISSTDSQLNAGLYYWDMTISTDEGDNTVYKGFFKIIPR